MKRCQASIKVLALLATAFLGAAQVPSEKSQRERTEQQLYIVGENILVSGDQPRHPHVEPHVAANPDNPLHLVATTIAFTRPDGKGVCAVLHSFDGGRTWTRSKLPTLENRTDLYFGADPWVAFGSGGVVFCSCLVENYEPGAQSRRRNHVYVFRSADGGRSWSEPVVMPRGEEPIAFDRTSIFADTTKGKFSGSIYVYSSGAGRTSTGHLTFPPKLWRSTDGGRTFSEPSSFHPSNLNVNAMNVVVLSDGAVVLPFYDVTTHDQRFLKHARLWVVLSRDGGRSFSTPYFGAEVSTESFRVFRDMKLAVDQSSMNSRDRLYLVWNDVLSGAADIYLAYSADKGETWSEPVRVSDNANRGFENQLPAIAINRDGVVGVSWFARSNVQNKKCTEVYFSASPDGGRAFLPSVRISTAPSCPDVPGNAVRYLPDGNSTVAERYAIGGDYSGLVASADGLFHVLWADSRTGVFQSWTATVKIIAAPIRNISR